MSSYSYLLHSSSEGQRSYIRQALSDKIITYSVNSQDPSAGIWIDRCFNYLSQILDITFQRINSGNAELTFNCRTISSGQYDSLSWRDLNYILPNGQVNLSQIHGETQYGGVTDIRSIARIIGLSLGLSYPDGDPWNSLYSTDISLMSLNPNAYSVGDLGRIFFFTDNDQNVLKNIFGPRLGSSSRTITYHQQQAKEDLLIGTNGSKDIFLVSSKGVLNTPGKIASNGMSNDYNCVSIANFNPADGDQILISKDLFNPASWGDYLPTWSSSARDNLTINYKQTTSSEDNYAVWQTNVNVTYDDAGKLMLNVDGPIPLCGPGPFPGNGQLAAFVDVTGPWINALSQSDFNTYDPNIDFYFVSPADEIIKRTTPGSFESASFVSREQKMLNIVAPGWSYIVLIDEQIKGANSGQRLDGTQIKIGDPQISGSCIVGGNSNDTIAGKAGWDILDGGNGHDLVHAGNGRDILTGGVGNDELWGDFGWNTYKSERDGFRDLIVVKSDQYLVNWMNNRSGNNPNGEKCDIITGLDSFDSIRIVGVDTSELDFKNNASAHGLSGIGIYAKGALEALYIGGDLSLSQIQAITTGDGSIAATKNLIYSYGWTQNPGFFVPM